MDFFTVLKETQQFFFCLKQRPHGSMRLLELQPKMVAGVTMSVVILIVVWLGLIKGLA